MVGFPTAEQAAVENLRLHDGQFFDGDPVNNIPPSRDPAKFNNAVLQELETVLRAADMTPDWDNPAQLLPALQTLLDRAKITVDLASTEEAGIVELATLAEAQAGAPGALVITAELLMAVLADLDKIINIAEQVNTLGDMRLWGFRPEELPTGWHVCNGLWLNLADADGQALNNLSPKFKSDWGITISGSQIKKPNLLTGGAVAGQGPFFRPSTSVPGSITTDAIRNITGMIQAYSYSSGAIYRGKRAGNVAAGPQELCYEQMFDASLVVPTSPENRPLAVAMTPAIWLGC